MVTEDLRFQIKQLAGPAGLTPLFTALLDRLEAAERGLAAVRQLLPTEVIREGGAALEHAAELAKLDGRTPDARARAIDDACCAERIVNRLHHLFEQDRRWGWNWDFCSARERGHQGVHELRELWRSIIIEELAILRDHAADLSEPR